MAFAAWGIAILVGYSLLQIPAVILIARYCEVDAADLPTPPMRGFWTDRARSDDDSTAGDAAKPADDAPTPRDPGTGGDTGLTVGGVRCDRCGEQNDPSFGRCRNCVAQL